MEKKKNLYISFYQQEEDIFTFLLDLLRDSRFEKNGYEKKITEIYFFIKCLIFKLVFRIQNSI